jgi:ABC-type sugar transport system permease subunit/outer membrane protein assembly factor BamB
MRQKRSSALGWISLVLLLLSAMVATPVLADGEQPLGTLWDDTLPDIVYGVATNADGSLVVYGGRDGIVYARSGDGQNLWEREVGGTVLHVEMAADGDRIAVATETRVLTLFDREGNTLWTHSTKMPPVGLGISDDGSLIVVGEERKPRVTVLNGDDGSIIFDNEYDVRIEYATISGDGSKFYTGGRDARVNCYAIPSGELQWSIMLDRVIYAIAAPDDGDMVYAGGDGSRVQALDLEAGGQVWTFEAEHRITQIRVAQDGGLIGAASWDGQVYLLDDLGTLQQRVDGGSRVHALGMSADGSVIVAGTNEGRLFAVSAASAREAQAVQSRNRIITAIIAVVLAAAVIAATATYIRRNPEAQAWWNPRWAAMQRLGRRIWRGRMGYLFMLPTLLFLLVFNYYPAIMGLGLGFTEWRPGQVDPPQWVGLHNFELVMDNPNTTAAARNAGILMVADLIKQLVGPLIIAEMIFALSSGKAQYTWRTLFIVPMVVPGVATILMWNSIFDPNLGLINNTLFALGWVTRQNPPTWFGDPNLALPSLIFIGFPWIGAFPFLIYYGGLITISKDIFDAAKVDGATGLQRVFLIDIPMLLPQIRLLSVLAVINSLQNFGLIILTTRGGPGNATTIPAYEMYMQGINSGRYGYAAAMASILFVVIMGITFLNLRLGKRIAEVY